nr:NP [Chapparvovirus sp.]
MAAGKRLLKWWNDDRRASSGRGKRAASPKSSGFTSDDSTTADDNRSGSGITAGSSTRRRSRSPLRCDANRRCSTGNSGCKSDRRGVDGNRQIPGRPRRVISGIETYINQVYRASRIYFTVKEISKTQAESFDDLDRSFDTSVDIQDYELSWRVIINLFYLIENAASSIYDD